MLPDEMWLKPFPVSSIPAWPCPRCQIGALRLLCTTNSETNAKAPELIERWDAGSVEEWKNGYPYPDGLFAMLLGCHRTVCDDVVVVSGKFSTEDYFEDNEMTYRRVYSPASFTPAVHLFHVQEKCPNNIREQLAGAFSAFWSDTGSCLNRIRCAIELLLTQMRVPKMKVLHDRILELQKTNKDMAEHMMAVKWLGNAGSHSRTCSKHDALDGFRLLEHVLNERFSPIGAVTRSINRRRGPRARPKK